VTDVWASGDAYEPYIGRWSRRVARKFLQWLAVPSGRRWLDVGCGTGALTAAILASHAPSHVLAVDASPAYIDWARTHLADPRARFEIADAAQLPVSAVDVAVSALVLNFVPDPAAVVRAMGDAAAGGTVAAYVWDYAGRMELIRYFWDAAIALDASAAPLDEGVRFSLCRPDRLASLWTEAGFAGVDVRAIDVATVFADFEDYWTPFLGGQGPAPGYAMALDEDRRGALRDRVKARLPVAADGSISLVARAWAVRGRAPSRHPGAG
jgi:trans-aconitate methyltransferase